jgi:hypothetical protein
MLQRLLAACAAGLAFSATASANDSAEMERMRAEIQQMKQSYEARIQALENKLEKVQASAGKAEVAASKAENTATEVASKSQASSSAFNPGISLILSGTYANLSQNPNNYTITGFQSGGDIGPGERGFSLAESELDIYGNIDHYFYGSMSLALEPDDTASVEEAFIQTTALPAGFTLKAGRYYSGIGYLNSQHAHTWDFVDSPLVYQAFLGGQYNDDGVQLKWVAPTDLFVELGAEGGRGRIAGSDGQNKNGTAAGSVFAHLGGDVGASNSWRAGLSYLHISPNGMESNSLDDAGDYVTNTFDGTYRIWIADGVWKWAPNGNASRTNFKLQGEYMHRDADGTLYFDGNDPGHYSASQSGWYVQGVYQFMPEWRTALRYDRLDSGSVNYGANSAFLPESSYNPDRVSLMFDYNPSEFSRIRLQLERDKSQEHETDNQLYLQYIMSLGSHGAHQF